jgi:hypothetical protein
LEAGTRRLPARPLAVFFREASASAASPASEAADISGFLSSETSGSNRS